MVDLSNGELRQPMAESLENPRTGPKAVTDSYARAGVDVDAGNEAVTRYRQLLGAWRHRDQLEVIGGFAGLFRLPGDGNRALVASNDGEIPGERTFFAATRIKPSAWEGRFWARWSEAVRDAAYEPNERTKKIPDDDMLKQLAGYITKLGHFPIREEINIHARTVAGFPVWQTISKRFGGMPQTVAALLEFGRTSANDALVKLCETKLEREKLKPSPKANAWHQVPTKLGFVYLKYSPSLRLYKIGKANDPVKRGAGISLLLPEDLVPKHEIRTDCPYILEKYWENRFRAKKKQGEWYDLNSTEIEAFKKRREFMFSEFFP